MDTNDYMDYYLTDLYEYYGWFKGKQPILLAVHNKFDKQTALLKAAEQYMDIAILDEQAYVEYEQRREGCDYQVEVKYLGRKISKELFDVASDEIDIITFEIK